MRECVQSMQKNLHEHIRGNWSEEKRQKRQKINKSQICQSNMLSYLLCAALVSKSASESSYVCCACNDNM